jgi:hypothetical protein
MRAAIPVILALMFAGSAGWAEVVVNHDFEEEDPLQAWSSALEYDVISKELSTDQPHSGQRSLKLELKMTRGERGGAHCYWLMPLTLPQRIAGNHFRVRGFLRVEQMTGTAKVGMGISYSGASIQWCPGGMLGQPTDGWREFSLDTSTVLLKKPDAVMEGVFVGFIYAGDATIYVDDVTVETGEPTPEVAERLAADRSHRNVLRARIAERAEDVRARLDAVGPEAQIPAALGPHAQRLRDFADLEMAQVADLASSWGEEPPAYVALYDMRERVDKLAHVADSLVALGAGPVANDRCVLYGIEPVRNDLPNPETFPLPGAPLDGIELTCCRGEYEPAAVAVHALSDLANVTLTLSPFVDEANAPVAIEGDVRVVKSWYQQPGGRGYVLTPELLLKDDAFIATDPEAKVNIYRDPEAPRDSDRLQPLSIPADSSRTFWITVHVPADAPAGSFTSELTVTGEAVELSVPLSLRVPEWDLGSPSLRYSCYYRGRPSRDEPGLGSDNLNAAQFEADLRSMLAHGITNPWMYLYPARDAEGKQDWSSVDLALEVRVRVGMTEGPLVLVGNAVGIAAIANADTPEKQAATLSNIRSQAKRYQELTAKHGFEQFAVYGVDEASADVLKAQEPAFDAIHELGGLICGANVDEHIDLCATGAGHIQSDPEMLARVHAWGGTLYFYNDPYGWTEEAYTWRLHYGLRAWLLGVDGVSNYAWRDARENAYNEGVEGGRRQMAFTYPTADGVIDTVQWEGFREGIDDVRYVCALEEAIARAKLDPAKREEAVRAEAWLQEAGERLRSEHLVGEKQPFTGSDLCPAAETADLTGLRREVIAWVDRLQ